MMTRNEFIRAIIIAPFNNEALRKHDAEQREEIIRLRKALQLLYDVQNGCPLPKYRADWDKAMGTAEELLKEHS